LRRLANDMTSLSPRPLRQSSYREVIAFRRPARENNLPRLRSDRHRDRFPRPLDRLPGLQAKTMADAARVAKLLAKKRQHRLHHPRIHPRRGMIVEINGQLDGHWH